MTRYSIKNILNLNEDLNLNDLLNKFFVLSKHSVIKLYSELDRLSNLHGQYVFPTSNLDYATNLRLLTILSFLICYEITNNDIITLNLQQIIDNKKLVTPDVFFYSIVLLNEILEKSEQNNWKDQFKEIIEIIDNIGKIAPNTFDVDLNELKYIYESRNDKDSIDELAFGINNA